MAETPDETRREIEETRLRIAAAAEELEERFRKTTDWQHTVKDYPLETALGALGIGFVLGSGLIFRTLGAIFGGGSRRSKQEQVVMRSGASFGILDWVRPMITPAVTALVLDYVRGPQQVKVEQPPQRRPQQRPAETQ